MYYHIFWFVHHIIMELIASWKYVFVLQFRYFANKVGNLERPFLKEFFPRWVGSCGCPVLKYDS